jgi:hypothetical protein
MLHVVGRTADGLIWHTMRSPTGWTPFINALQAARPAGLAVHRGRVRLTAASNRPQGRP